METSSFSNIYKQVLFSASLIFLFSSCTKEYVYPETNTHQDNSSRLVSDQKYDPILTSSNSLPGGSEINPGKNLVSPEVAPEPTSSFSKIYNDQKKDEIEIRTDGKTTKLSLEQKNQDLPISTDKVFVPDFKKKDLKSSTL